MVLSIVLFDSAIDSTVREYYRQYRPRVLSIALFESTVDSTVRG